jgi:chromosomal replication initiation ATPase DnaA
VRREFAAPVIEAPSNEAARAWLSRTAEWPSRRLALWGPQGSGKTRLLSAWAERNGAERLHGATLRFAPPETAVAIDDADRAPTLALLHTLNAAHEAGHPVLLAATTPPARWPVSLPEDDLLHALLPRLLAERQLRPSETTLHWLLARLPRTHAALAEAVERLDRAAQAFAVPIAPALARQVLPDLLADLPDSPEPANEDSVSPSPSADGLL